MPLELEKCFPIINQHFCVPLNRWKKRDEMKIFITDERYFDVKKGLNYSHQPINPLNDEIRKINLEITSLRFWYISVHFTFIDWINNTFR